MNKYENLIKGLENAAKTDKGITFINSYDEEDFLSYHDLLNKAYFILNSLQAKGIKENDELVFQLSNSNSLISMLWACLLGKIIAIPLAVINNQHTSEKLISVWRTLDNPYLVYDSDKIFNMLSNVTSNDIPNLDLIKKITRKSLSFDDLFTETQSILSDQSGSIDYDDNIAYLQYSSGSTGTPKGVILKHHNIMINIYDMITQYHLSEKDTFLTWKPLTHDFCMIFFHLMPAILGVNQYHIPTNSFIRSPLLWFHKVHQHKATILGSTPFGIQHFMLFKKKSKIALDWDLQSVKGIIIGAEYISYGLCREFTAEMEKYHLKRNAFIPVYGLAEATLIVTSNKPDEEMKVCNLNRKKMNIGQKVGICSEPADENGIQFVDVGSTLPNTQLAIRDDTGGDLNDLEIGHICIKGDSVTSGYYKNEKATRDLIDRNGWLDTGDIGFISNHRMVMVGRTKEIIVVNGANYAPHDIEEVIDKNINEDKSYKYLACNGFNNHTKKEQLIVFVYYKNKLEKFVDLAKKVKTVVIEKMGLMVDEVIPINKIPKTTSGKVRRVELSQRYNNGDFDSVIGQIRELSNNEPFSPKTLPADFSRNEIMNLVLQQVESVLENKVNDFDQTFVDMGLVSVNVPGLLTKIENLFHINLSVSFVYDYPTVNLLVDHIDLSLKKSEKTNKAAKTEHTDRVEEDENSIAIVGMSCRFPGGANDPESFWNLLINGIDGISEVPENRWDADKYYNADKNVPGKMYTKKGGFLDIAVDMFDAQFFNISPKEAMSLDPQQRILLELTWEAFENGGLDITQYSKTNTGVYLGISGEEYSLGHRSSGDFNKIDAYSLTGTTFSTACGRISYTFGFEGPSMAIDTACSSALTAFHVACKGIRNGEADAAIVAGVNIILTPNIHVCFSKLQAISPDGCSKTFDASANGYCRGEGAAVVILKKLKLALRDNDNILAVVRGTSVNQDGKSNGLTAPSGLAQQKVIINALQDAKLNALDIDYIEMHGTGTPLGDPIEVKALSETYCSGRKKDNPLLIGSVKSNIGHLEAAAGMASIIKVILSFKNGMLPGNLNFKDPNPFIPWDVIPVKVVSKTMLWKSNQKVKRVGINAFGFGGSNAHVILEEAPKKLSTSTKAGFPVNILKISAKSKASLDDLLKKYADFIKDHPDTDIKDICYTANVYKTDFDYRFAAFAVTREELIKKLDAYSNHEKIEGIYSNIDHKAQNDGRIIFLFSGQGSQYKAMGKELYRNQPVFRQCMDECDSLFRPYILKSVLDLIYADDANESQIDQTVYAQPLIFSIEYALYRMWESWGVTPFAVLGHSIGEFAAAVAASVMSLSDAVKLVATRGRLMHSAPGEGTMGTIFADEMTVLSLIEKHLDEVSIAAVNAESSVVISGEKVIVDDILKQAGKEGFKNQKLQVSHGFHSPLMSPILNDFKSVASGVNYQKPKIKFLSSLLAEFMDETIPDADYWTRHIQEKVRFYDCLMVIKKMGNFIFLEVGAHTPLCSLGKMSLDDNNVFIPSLSKKQHDLEQIASSLGELYTRGVNINWEYIFDGRSNKVSLPTYPFERKQFWMQPVFEHQVSSPSINAELFHPFIGHKITTPHLENSVIYQSTFTPDKPYFMKEHIIFNSPISPAAAHVSMLLSASRHMHAPESCVLENVEFQNPLIVNNDEERLVQIYLQNFNSNGMNFEISSRDAKHEHMNWVKHSIGAVRSIMDDQASNIRVSIDELKGRFPEDDSGSGFDFYQLFSKIGFNLGPGFQCIEKIWNGTNEGLCLISPKADIPDQDNYDLYPGIIDSIFQSATAIHVSELENKLKEKSSEDLIKTIIPISLLKLTYHFRETKEFWCHTKVDIQKEVIVANIDVYNESGELIFEIENLVAKITDRRSLLKDLIQDDNHMLYTIKWVEKKAKNNIYSYKDNEKFIMFEDYRGLIQSLCKTLSDHSINTFKVKKGETYQKLNDNNYFVSYHSKADVQKLILDVIGENGSGNNTIIYAWGLDSSDPSKITPNKLFKEQRIICEGLLNLIQVLAEQYLTENFKVWVITENVHDINDTTASISISQSTLWGFAKVIELEYPQLWGGIIDIDSGIIVNGQVEILKEIKTTDEKQVCLRSDNKRYVQRLVKDKGANRNNMEPDVLPQKIKRDATYLLTGGTGALGLIFTEYLINKGAKYLVLIGRRKPGNIVLSKIEEWGKQGINILVIQADVSNEADVKNLFQKVSGSMPAIKGVIHGAGSIEDRMINEQTWDSFYKVLEPKVIGTWILHDTLRDCDLDFFAMFSSITSVFGNIGQSNYAAANCFLNVFSNFRKQNNLPAISICWGPWSEAGMAASNSKAIQQMSQRGLFGISTDAGLKVMDRLIDDPNHRQILVADVDWQAFANKMGSEDIKNVLSDLINIKGVPKETEEIRTLDILNKLKELKPEERHSELLLHLQFLVAKIMGFDDYQQVSVDKALMEQGADSLMVFSMRNELSKITGKTLNATIFFNYPSLVKISDYLLSEVLVFEDMPLQQAKQELKTVDILSEIQSLIK